MTISDNTTVECWSCGKEQTVTYGGRNNAVGTERCENCNEVIAEKGIDTLTIPENAEQAYMIKERNDDFSLTERLLRFISWS